ncbi:hypothetical protein LTR99_004068 [Exophiala xenobiotica]|uniref:Uncharacterized protein n=1 Tax=Vermiconidia calcicola TaxID=1690605 RepID=A0AAV9QNV8_9PEZI|nr:hypothetical protein LTR41_006484 [Exophiala xenobiotica]KAK5545170.1 hypothetical protein LTR25_000177 [Vermiconidia calcicola]KAK5549184.1 hypothetical protein LTR23_001014 [Chaetothyriales sp. CCFEE 6169]KAK5305002.1 hypothetical protein LTR99_004068 [Exophiala xenobiotica]KAK5435537.1 hypothetical protein LTR34_003041 [Exophiala xenobiotica]
MTTSVSVHVEDRVSGKNANGNVPANGQKQTFGALYGTSFGGQVVANAIFVQTPATAQGLKIVVSDEHGTQKAVLDDNGTPFVIGSQAVDITHWYITAQKQ